VVTGGEGSGGGEAVEKGGAMWFPSGERGREGCGKAGSERVDCAVKGNGGLTLGKRIFFVDALFLLTPLRSRLSVKSVKIGTPDDFLRASEARSLQRFPRSFRNLNSRDS
jgi:hypothetical protein